MAIKPEALPKNFFLDRLRGVVVFSKMVEGKRFTRLTEYQPTDPKLTKKVLEDLREGFVLEMRGRGAEKVVKGIKVRHVLDNYVAYLQRREAEKGVGQGVDAGERPNSYNVANFFKGHLSYFADMKPQSVKDHLDAYRTKREKAGASPTTINTEFRNLRAALNHAVHKGVVPESAVPKSKQYPFNYDGEKASERTRTIPDAVFEKIQSNLADHLKPYVLALRYTGLRPVEARRLLREDVIVDGPLLIDPVSGKIAPRINAVNRKNGVGKAPRPKVVTVLDELLPVLKEWKERTEREHPEGKFFFHENGERLGDCKTAWKGAQERAGIPEGKTYMLYDCRRTTSTNEFGRLPKELRKKQMGQLSDAMDHRYMQDDIAHVVATRDAVAARKGHQTTTRPAPIETVASDALEAELLKLKTLFDKGLVTQTVYEAKQAKLLGV